MFSTSRASVSKNQKLLRMTWNTFWFWNFWSRTYLIFVTIHIHASNHTDAILRCGSNGGRLWVQFLSFACSFREKFGQIISWLPLWGLAPLPAPPPGLRNSGSVTDPVNISRSFFGDGTTSKVYDCSLKRFLIENKLELWKTKDTCPSTFAHI